jgi:hypothetical protein
MPMTRRMFAAALTFAVIGPLVGGLCLTSGCSHPPPQYGVERPYFLPARKRQVWAIAPVLNLSGQKVDSILQADIVFEQLQQVEGIIVVPVNRTVEVLASLRLEKVQSEKQAALVCDLLGCDGLIVATVTAYDPYDPPKLGASLQWFGRSTDAARPAGINPRDLARQAALPATQPLPPAGGIVQVVGMYDAQNGSVRAALANYVKGRHDPLGPLGAKEYLVSMDHYCGFVYHSLIADLLDSPKMRRNLQ